MLFSDYYNYEELKEKAFSSNATREDKIALYNWLERHNSKEWNGYHFEIEHKRIKPIYDTEFNVIDVEIY